MTDTPLAGLRILVVEDEPLISMLLESALTQAGAEVIGPAGRVVDALALLGIEMRDERGRVIPAEVPVEDTEPAIAVLDLNLEGVYSTPVADALKARNVPFVVATGYGREGLPARHQGVPVINKPYSMSDLVKVLQQARIKRLPEGAA